jgi:outer membrane protein OmpA-like peptidoglycan-associated protein
MPSRLAWNALVLLIASGCANRYEDPEIAARCTSISNVIEKNYHLGANLNAVAAGGGFAYTRSGVVLTPEAAERQITMDRLCRAWVKNKVDDKQWERAYIGYILASAAPASRSGDAKVQRELVKNLAELRQALDGLAQLKATNETTQPLSIPSVEDLKSMLENSLKESDKQAQARLDELARSLQSAWRQDVGRQLTDAVEILQRDVAGIARKLQAGSVIWTALPTFQLGFERNKTSLDAKAVLKLHTELLGLKEVQDYRIELVGYADSSGSLARNSQLSAARALEVQSYLITEMGLSVSKVFASGHRGWVTRFGDEPQKNRVVDVRVYVLAPRSAAEGSAATQ